MKKTILAVLLLCSILVLASCKEEVVAPRETLGKDLLTFSAYNFDEEEVTEAIWQEHEVNMIFLWGTSWPSCIQELPEIALLEQELEGQDVGIVAVLTDYRSVGTAITLVESHNLMMTNLLLSEDLYASMSEVQYIPYVYFVDNEGRSLGVEFSSAKSAEEMLDYIAQARANIK